MQWLHLTFALVLFAQYVFGRVPGPAPSVPGIRFGITFSPTTITTSRLDASGSLELNKFPVSSSYQAHYHEAVHKFNVSNHGRAFDEANVKSIFHDVMNTVTEKLSEQVGHAPEYAALFLPSIFDSNTQNAASDAIHGIPEYATKTAPSRQAACYGYGFLEGRNLGRPQDECTGYGPESLVLLLEYEQEYIYAWLLEVTFELGTYYVNTEKICKGCGEIHQEKIGEQAYQERVKEFLGDFIARQVLPKNKREDIRAIVIAGEASSETIKQLGITALNAVGTEEVRLMTHIDPSEVVAHGAAVFARMTEEHPDRFTAYDGNRIPDDEYWAHEKSEGRWTPDDYMLLEHSELR